MYIVHCTMYTYMDMDSTAKQSSVNAPLCSEPLTFVSQVFVEMLLVGLFKTCQETFVCTEWFHYKKIQKFFSFQVINSVLKIRVTQ